MVGTVPGRFVVPDEPDKTRRFFSKKKPISSRRKTRRFLKIDFRPDENPTGFIGFVGFRRFHRFLSGFIRFFDFFWYAQIRKRKKKQHKKTYVYSRVLLGVKPKIFFTESSPHLCQFTENADF